VASLIENLITVLGDENDEYQRMLTVSREKTDAIVRGDVARLQEILGEEESVIERLDTLEARRQEHIEDIANVLNVPLEDMKVDLLVRMLEKQPKDRDALVRVHDALKATTSQLMVINENNKVLIKESLEMLEFEINVIRNSRMAPETANYSKDAYGVGQNGYMAGTFDAKQ
jgi:flagellar biosynthesis/type III secretory pathway chaperone